MFLNEIGWTQKIPLEHRQVDEKKVAGRKAPMGHGGMIFPSTHSIRLMMIKVTVNIMAVMMSRSITVHHCSMISVGVIPVTEAVAVMMSVSFSVRGAIPVSE